ncbi:L-threonylcarbamoyladenylate synthase [Candidatus Sneabacter namystus]|uniref:Threonylcarbamoyl-AMP synthase n=1 Tax=Candidatus Sneabacter namystus TaxID=2601646 RepID=A0A5C0UI22_9RICK|nr:L-threonylcarbamoyladenylate synthase [Candidatus Sneabacter namystus]QEK39716.1 threonylcarbamoyl-AMP synthase [Candidatus Sneabacter namystus]
MQLKSSILQSVMHAANLIREGHVVAFPTETVFGLGADATSFEACEKIFEIKKRPKSNPLIVHVRNMQNAMEFGVFENDAKKIAEMWPAPITLITYKTKDCKIASNVTSGPAIAIRCPNHSIAQELLNISSVPIAAPSANYSSRITATTTAHIIKDFSGKVPVLNGIVSIGIESTIIDTRDKIRIIRQGTISAEQIYNSTGVKVYNYDENDIVVAPGTQPKHYSPISPIRINADHLFEGEIGLGFAKNNFTGKAIMNLSKAGDLNECAHNLYAMLRIADENAQKIGCGIAVARIPNHGIGIAINDRLTRASYKS